MNNITMLKSGMYFPCGGRVREIEKKPTAKWVKRSLIKDWCHDSTTSVWSQARDERMAISRKRVQIDADKISYSKKPVCLTIPTDRNKIIRMWYNRWPGIVDARFYKTGIEDWYTSEILRIGEYAVHDEMSMICDCLAVALFIIVAPQYDQHGVNKEDVKTLFSTICGEDCYENGILKSSEKIFENGLFRERVFNLVFSEIPTNPGLLMVRVGR